MYPPWKRQRKSGIQKKLTPGSLKASTSQTSAKQLSKYRVETTRRKPFTDQENMFIIAERNRGTTWEKIASMMLDRTPSQVKKYYHAHLKPKRKYNKQQVKEKGTSGKTTAKMTTAQTSAAARPQAGAGVAAGPGPVTGAAQQQQLLHHPPVMVAVPPADLENKLYNKIVSVPKKMDKSGNRPQLYFVLNFNEIEDKCHLVPLMEDGTFISGKKRYKLVPEGEGEELEGVDAKTCTVVKSVATNKVQDADQEAWLILDAQYD